MVLISDKHITRLAVVVDVNPKLILHCNNVEETVHRIQRAVCRALCQLAESRPSSVWTFQFIDSSLSPLTSQNNVMRAIKHLREIGKAQEAKAQELSRRVHKGKKRTQEVHKDFSWNNFYPVKDLGEQSSLSYFCKILRILVERQWEIASKAEDDLKSRPPSLHGSHSFKSSYLAEAGITSGTSQHGFNAESHIQEVVKLAVAELKSGTVEMQQLGKNTEVALGELLNLEWDGVKAASSGSASEGDTLQAPSVEDARLVLLLAATPITEQQLADFLGEDKRILVTLAKVQQAYLPLRIRVHWVGISATLLTKSLGRDVREKQHDSENVLMAADEESQGAWATKAERHKPTAGVPESEPALLAAFKCHMRALGWDYSSFDDVEENLKSIIDPNHQPTEVVLQSLTRRSTTLSLLRDNKNCLATVEVLKNKEDSEAGLISHACHVVLKPFPLLSGKIQTEFEERKQRRLVRKAQVSQAPSSSQLVSALMQEVSFRSQKEETGETKAFVPEKRSAPERRPAKQTENMSPGNVIVQGYMGKRRARRLLAQGVRHYEVMCCPGRVLSDEGHVACECEEWGVEMVEHIQDNRGEQQLEGLTADEWAKGTGIGHSDPVVMAREGKMLKERLVSQSALIWHGLTQFLNMQNGYVAIVNVKLQSGTWPGILEAWGVCSGLLTLLPRHVAMAVKPSGSARQPEVAKGIKYTTGLEGLAADEASRNTFDFQVEEEDKSLKWNPRLLTEHAVQRCEYVFTKTQKNAENIRAMMKQHATLIQSRSKPVPSSERVFSDQVAAVGEGNGNLEVADSRAVEDLAIYGVSGPVVGSQSVLADQGAAGVVLAIEGGDESKSATIQTAAEGLLDCLEEGTAIVFLEKLNERVKRFHEEGGLETGEFVSLLVAKVKEALRLERKAKERMAIVVQADGVSGGREQPQSVHEKASERVEGEEEKNDQREPSGLEVGDVSGTPQGKVGRLFRRLSNFFMLPLGRNSPCDIAREVKCGGEQKEDNDLRQSAMVVVNAADEEERKRREEEMEAAMREEERRDVDRELRKRLFVKLEKLRKKYDGDSFNEMTRLREYEMQIMLRLETLPEDSKTLPEDAEWKTRCYDEMVRMFAPLQFLLSLDSFHGCQDFSKYMDQFIKSRYQNRLPETIVQLYKDCTIEQSDSEEPEKPQSPQHPSSPPAPPQLVSTATVVPQNFRSSSAERRETLPSTSSQTHTSSRGGGGKGSWRETHGGSLGLSGREGRSLGGSGREGRILGNSDEVERLRLRREARESRHIGGWSQKDCARRKKAEQTVVRKVEGLGPSRKGEKIAGARTEGRVEGLSFLMGAPRERPAKWTMPAPAAEDFVEETPNLRARQDKHPSIPSQSLAPRALTSALANSLLTHERDHNQHRSHAPPPPLPDPVFKWNGVISSQSRGNPSKGDGNEGGKDMPPPPPRSQKAKSVGAVGPGPHSKRWEAMPPPGSDFIRERRRRISHQCGGKEDIKRRFHEVNKAISCSMREEPPPDSTSPAGATDLRNGSQGAHGVGPPERKAGNKRKGMAEEGAEIGTFDGESDLGGAKHGGPVRKRAFSFGGRTSGGGFASDEEGESRDDEEFVGQTPHERRRALHSAFAGFGDELHRTQFPLGAAIYNPPKAEQATRNNDKSILVVESSVKVPDAQPCGSEPPATAAAPTGKAWSSMASPESTRSPWKHAVPQDQVADDVACDILRSRNREGTAKNLSFEFGGSLDAAMGAGAAEREEGEGSCKKRASYGGGMEMVIVPSPDVFDKDGNKAKKGRTNVLSPRGAEDNGERRDEGYHATAGSLWQWPEGERDEGQAKENAPEAAKGMRNFSGTELQCADSKKKRCRYNAGHTNWQCKKAAMAGLISCKEHAKLLKGAGQKGKKGKKTKEEEGAVLGAVPVGEQKERAMEVNCSRDDRGEGMEAMTGTKKGLELQPLTIKTRSRKEVGQGEGSNGDLPNAAVEKEEDSTVPRMSREVCSQMFVGRDTAGPPVVEQLKEEGAEVLLNVKLEETGGNDKRAARRAKRMGGLIQAG